MSTKILEVANAVANVYLAAIQSSVASFNDLPEETRHIALNMAEAAIQAMSIPTAAMLRAGEITGDQWVRAAQAALHDDIINNHVPDKEE